MKTFAKLMSACAVIMAAQSATAQELTVGYFLEWPMPFLAAKADGTYDEALGMPVKWVAFETGTAMSAAMASGDVQIALSQGTPPFVVATSAGQALQLLDIAVSYSENDNCVVSTQLEIDKDSADELEGKKVAIPIGTASHYGFLRQMDHFGVDVSTMTVVDMAPTDGAAALAQGEVDFACGYGGGLTRMKESGNVLLTGAEKEELGILVFDVTSAPADFVVENEALVSKFLGVTAAVNSEWKETHSPEILEKIASESGMSVEAAEASISGFDFPTIDEQLSQKWLGGNVSDFMKGVADVFVEAGSISTALDSYANTVNPAPLAAAQ
jgi:taurine transport system substrate-binding protein